MIFRNYKKVCFSIGVLAAIFLLAFKPYTVTTKYKYLVQMNAYTGEGAYVIVSLLNSNGDYEKTLAVHGKDEHWYYEIDSWWAYYGKTRANIDAITGETIKGDQRDSGLIEIEAEKINKGYKIRFETSVEDNDYHINDVIIELNSSALNKKISGSGFIDYVRLLEL